MAEIEGVSGTRVILYRRFLVPWNVGKWNAREDLVLVTRECGIVAELRDLSSVLFNESHASVSAEAPREPIPFENARPKYAVRIEIKAECIEKMWVPNWQEGDVQRSVWLRCHFSDMGIDNWRFRFMYRLCFGERLGCPDVRAFGSSVGPMWTGALPVIGLTSRDGIAKSRLGIRCDGEGFGVRHTAFLCDLSLTGGKRIRLLWRQDLWSGCCLRHEMRWSRDGKASQPSDLPRCSEIKKGSGSRFSRSGVHPPTGTFQ